MQFRKILSGLAVTVALVTAVPWKARGDDAVAYDPAYYYLPAYLPAYLPSYLFLSAEDKRAITRRNAAIELEARHAIDHPVSEER
jgi:hypothetical protein